MALCLRVQFFLANPVDHHYLSVLYCLSQPGFRSFWRRSKVWIIHLQWNRNKVFVLPSEIIHPSSSNITQVSGHSVNFDVILRVDSSYRARISKSSATGYGWLDPCFITNKKFVVNAVVPLVILRFIVQKWIKPFVVTKFTCRNNALITPSSVRRILKRGRGGQKI